MNDQQSTVNPTPQRHSCHVQAMTILATSTELFIHVLHKFCRYVSLSPNFYL